MDKIDGGQVPIAFPRRPKGDMTAEERDHVRAALRHLRIQHGGWERLAKAIRAKPNTIQAMQRCRPPTAGLAVRLARLAGVPVDDVLAGRFPPPGACPHCGRGPQADPSP